MLKLVMLAGLMLLIMIAAKATRLMPHGTAARRHNRSISAYTMTMSLSLSRDPIIGGPSSLALGQRVRGRIGDSG